MDVRNKILLEKLFKKYRPEVVFHAAAHKHVPLMEFNEIEAIQNNVGGTKNILELSVKYQVNDFILISTDKAVNPLSVMGVSKRLAELITSYYDSEKKLKTSIVRFGNVIGSRGSVLPLFKEQIEKGGPLTVTHPEMTRYFMSISEASLLVLNAAVLSEGGDLFVLDMGEQYKIIDIAKRLIKFYGYQPEKDIQIKFTGLRPGEKLSEDLFYSKDALDHTSHKKIFILKKSKSYFPKERIEELLEKELAKIVNYDSSELRERLTYFVPEYQP